MVRFGRKLPKGFLPVYSVADEEEARALLTLACPRNGPVDEWVSPELKEEQTLERLLAFSDRLDVNHERLKAKGLCRCQPPSPPPAPSSKKRAPRRRT